LSLIEILILDHEWPAPDHYPAISRPAIFLGLPVTVAP
jgi:hypothetical protein